MQNTEPHTPAAPRVKCVVWDLDDTLWDGTLLEGDDLSVPEANRRLVRTLDEHGILQSVASRNEPGPVAEQLSAFGLDAYFLYPQVGWSAKSASLRAVLRELNISPDSVLFVDDSEFERAEVASELPQVRCMTRQELHALVADGGVLPAQVTDDARRRRSMYLAESRRRSHEVAFDGPGEEFLRSLDMTLRVREATPADLARAAELTQRTHQLNTTGITFDEAELASLTRHPDHRVLVAELDDRFGTYGTIGLAVIGTGRTDAAAVADPHADAAPPWTIRLLLMSCRVMGRNVGSTLIAAVARLAAAHGAGTVALFRPTERNRQMLVTYRFAGFTVESRTDDLVVLSLPDERRPAVPGYVRLVVDDNPVAPRGTTKELTA
ncbi:HAD-IIIC family phosphatase [Streptomyces antarcticus]|uniref:HAD-IIIC family phosphatase n=1 Tax=Streptomyces antarcticus TaxID=2996458 RepID=UPI00226DB225|nr:MULTISPECIES: HAD-IIIC family phosphatase [unclassified Streptomyces]MCY0941029.1 HAD-IIIC family phosphatase [Streptomyces sp. H34-AA3]MCY0949568.1 HAD-IIIC family phosphatase [Streptomyces sp. H27-S2]MCZ4085577.1 HAD-IIIC family phosphatase [Streptomyces sp. H34-S5]